jgi:hypothetical protein
MSEPDYAEASRRSKEKLPWIRAGIEKRLQVRNSQI